MIWRLNGHSQSCSMSFYWYWFWFHGCPRFICKSFGLFNDLSTSWIAIVYCGTSGSPFAGKLDCMMSYRPAYTVCVMRKLSQDITKVGESYATCRHLPWDKCWDRRHYKHMSPTQLSRVIDHTIQIYPNVRFVKYSNPISCDCLLLQPPQLATYLLVNFLLLIFKL